MRGMQGGETHNMWIDAGEPTLDELLHTGLPKTI